MTNSTHNNIMINKKGNFSLAEMAAKSPQSEISFLLKLSHELKTPVHGIGGVSKYLRDHWASIDDETCLKSIDAIIHACNNLETLVDSLLDKASKQNQIKFNFAQLDIVQITKDTVSKYKDLHVYKNNIKIIFESQLKECQITMDSFWYGQLITNLISNSVNYSTEGTVIVKLSRSKIKGIENCIVCVQDEGVGIANSEVHDIFTPFYVNSQNNIGYSKGTGLGLPICREIVEAHGGIISASNNEGNGATIEFSFPMKIEI